LTSSTTHSRRALTARCARTSSARTRAAPLLITEPPIPSTPHGPLKKNPRHARAGPTRSARSRRGSPGLAALLPDSELPATCAYPPAAVHCRRHLLGALDAVQNRREGRRARRREHEGLGSATGAFAFLATVRASLRSCRERSEAFRLRCTSAFSVDCLPNSE